MSTPSVDLPALEAAPATPASPRGGDAGGGSGGVAGRLLGRDSVNRSQYRALRRASTAAPAAAGGRYSRPATPANTPMARPHLEAIPSATAPAGSAHLAPARARITSAQLEEVGRLLECYRTRAAFVAGGTRVKVEPSRLGRCACRNPLREGVLALYRFLENNTEPAVLAWKLPHEQLLELTMTARV
jgi:hypothetical protein